MKIAKQSVTLIDHMGSDLSVVNAARVSFHKESEWLRDDWGLITNLKEGDQKLIAYLAKHGHWTPFAHAFLSFRIKAPIFVARQLVKHQVGLAWNEVSRRYVDEEPEFWFPEVWRGKPVNAKQGSDGLVDEVTVDAVYDNGGYAEYVGAKEIARICLDWYNTNIKNGMAPEMARIMLPQNTMTEWIWSGSLAAFARVCKLRLDPHAQQETREIAEYINASVNGLGEFEHSWQALLGN